MKFYTDQHQHYCGIDLHARQMYVCKVILYEICTIERVPRVQDFVSYCRLVKPGRESNGKLLGHAGGKIGNAHLSRSRFTRVIPSRFTTAR